MRLYVEVARSTFRRIATYRAATVAGVFTNTVFGFVLAYVLLAVYRQRGTIGGFDATDAVTFTFVAQGMLMVVGMFGGNVELAERIRTGDVIVDLQRPYSQQGWWAGVVYGKAAYYAIFRGIPPFIAGAVVFDLRLPEARDAAAFVLSVVLAVGVAFGWGYLLQLCAFWLLDVRGPNQLGWLAAHFLSGGYLPIVLFPGWLEATARALPFASMLELPIEVWLGKHDGAELAGVYALQVAWFGALWIAGRAVLARAVRKVVIQGG